MPQIEILQADITRLKARMGWEHIPWVTITDSFDADFGVDEWHGHNAFIRDGDRIITTQLREAGPGAQRDNALWHFTLPARRASAPGAASKYTPASTPSSRTASSSPASSQTPSSSSWGPASDAARHPGDASARRTFQG